MAPRFVERIRLQGHIHRRLFGAPIFDPPSYEYTHSRQTSTSTGDSSSSSTSSDLPAYQRYPESYSHTESPCLPKGSLVLVTGANSWLGSHVVEQLLNHGYIVRGAVRDSHKASMLNKAFADRYGPGCYLSVIVPDMTVPGAYHTAARGCSGIIHVASIMTMSSNPNEVIPATIMGALNALEAAHREPMIRRFIYTSSVAAAATPNIWKRNEIASDSWNMTAFKSAWDPPPYESRQWNVFASSKLQAEQAVWKWYRQKRPDFILNCVLPDMLFGQAAISQSPLSSLGMHMLDSIADNKSTDVSWLGPRHFADVDDAALIHVAALILPGVMNERLFVTASSYSFETLTRHLRQACPHRRIRDPIDNHEFDHNVYIEAGRAEELLRRMGRAGWTDIETSVQRACQGIDAYHSLVENDVAEILGTHEHRRDTSAEAKRARSRKYSMRQAL